MELQGSALTHARRVKIDRSADAIEEILSSFAPISELEALAIFSARSLFNGINNTTNPTPARQTHSTCR